MIVTTRKNYPNTPYKVLWVNPGFAVKVDPELYDFLDKFHWFAKKSFHCWYVVCWQRVGIKRKLLQMHRLIANTPTDMVTHHINFNSMDNRRKNLMSLSEFEHAKYFSYR